MSDRFSALTESERLAIFDWHERGFHGWYGQGSDITWGVYDLPHNCRKVLDERECGSREEFEIKREQAQKYQSALNYLSGLYGQNARRERYDRAMALITKYDLNGEDFDRFNEFMQDVENEIAARRTEDLRTLDEKLAYIEEQHNEPTASTDQDRGAA